MKKLLCLLAVLLLSFSLLGCQKEEAQAAVTKTTDAQMETTAVLTEATAAISTEPETQPTTAPTEPPELWQENVLMSDVAWATPSAKVLGSSHKRSKDIVTITFLDSLTDAPETAWDVSEAQNGSVLAWLTDREDGMKELYIAGEGGVRAPENCDGLFADYQKVTNIHFNGNFHVTNDVTSMAGLFSGCVFLQEVDFTGWDTSNVVLMETMFTDCHGLTELDMTMIDTSSVTDFSGMFMFCDNLRRLDISTWDTSSAVQMNALFRNCMLLEELDVSQFDTSNVLGMHQIFQNCQSLKALDLSNWDTSLVEDMREFFDGCTALEALNLGNWEYDSVKPGKYTKFMGSGDYNGQPWMEIFKQ